MPDYHIDPNFWQRPTREIPDVLQEKFGKGIKYPLKLINNSSWLESVGEDHIRQSMLIILLTPVGTRIMQPDFGSMIPYIVFERASPSLLSEIDFYVRRSLERWEPRIEVTSVDIDDSGLDNNTLGIQITYYILGVGGKRSFTVNVPTNPNTSEYANPSQFTINNRQVF